MVGPHAPEITLSMKTILLPGMQVGVLVTASLGASPSCHFLEAIYLLGEVRGK